MIEKRVLSKIGSQHLLMSVNFLRFLKNQIIALFFQSERLQQHQIRFYESILKPFDDYFPKIFEKFWQWQQPRIWFGNLSIFDQNFQVWLKHLVICEKTKMKMGSNFTPRSENESWEGQFSQCLSKLKLSKWVNFPVFSLDQIKKYKSNFHKNTNDQSCDEFG